MATTINKFGYITCRRLPPFFEHKHRIVYSRIERVNNTQEIQHPAVRAVFDWARVDEGLEVHYDGDLPARAGLGSSSSFTVGLLHALQTINGVMATKDALACNAIHIEQNIIGENVGSQDQISASFGGFNRIEFRRNSSFEVSPIILPSWRREELRDHLMLCFTGFSRIASEVARSKIENFKNREKELKLMRDMVDEAVKLLQDLNESIDSFGRLLNVGWQYKRSLSHRVSTPEIDSIYEAAITAGAIGGKILGAGGGGFLLIFAKPDRHAAIRESLKKLFHVPFNFEDSGSRVVLYQPNGL